MSYDDYYSGKAHVRDSSRDEIITYFPNNDDYYGDNSVFVNDLQINATCFHGKIYLNESMELFHIACRPSSYFYSCI